jgi:hypothetical protein
VLVHFDTPVRRYASTSALRARQGSVDYISIRQYRQWHCARPGALSELGQCELNFYIDDTPVPVCQYVSTPRWAGRGVDYTIDTSGTPVRQLEEHYTEDGSDAISASVSTHQYVGTCDGHYHAWYVATPLLTVSGGALLSPYELPCRCLPRPSNGTTLALF